MSTTETFDTTGADVAMSREDREQARELVDVLDQLPTLSYDELVDRNNEKWPGNALWDDERGAGMLDLKYRPAALDLPGFGETRDDPECGTQLPYICDDCGKPIEVGRTCSQSMCPRCGAAWVIDRAESIVSNIWSAAKMKEGSQKLHHVAVDYVPGDGSELYVDAEKPEQEVADAITDFMDAIDMDGIVIYHGYRGADEDDVEDDRPLEREKGDLGEWKDRIFSGRDWEGDVREELNHEPHWHIIGACEWFPGGDVTKRIWEETGFLFERIAGANGRSINNDDMNSLARAVTYSLSHVCIDTRGDHNRYVRSKVGSSYHGADDRHDEQARKACQRVAPETLGIPSMEIECREELPEDEVEDDNHELVTPSSDGDGDDVEVEPEPSTSTATPTVPCQGGLSLPKDADFVEDEDWRQGALYAEDAVATKARWEAVGGWKGWIAHDLTIEDDPPP